MNSMSVLGQTNLHLDESCLQAEHPSSQLRACAFAFGDRRTATQDRLVLDCSAAEVGHDL